MSLISFIRDAGEKLFKKSEQGQEAPGQPQSQPQAQAPQVDVAALNAKAGEAIAALVQKQNLGIENLAVKYDGAAERVTLTGTAPTQEAAEKAVLCCGNVSGVVNKINDVLGQMVPIIIGFLASLVGLGGIGQKIRSIVETLQKPVTKALDFVIKTGLKLAGPIIRGIKGISGKVKAKVAAGKAWVKGRVEAGKQWAKDKVYGGDDKLDYRPAWEIG